MLLVGRAPACVATILIDLIPKREKGDRLVPTMSSFIRLPARWFRKIARGKWAQQNDRKFIFGASGRAAPACVWRMGVLTEMAAARSMSALAFLLDIAKAFENVSHWILAKNASDFKFPIAILRFWLALYQGPRRIKTATVIGREVRARGQTIIAGCSSADLFMPGY